MLGAGVPDSVGYIGAAIVAAVPSTLAWFSTRKTAKKIETNHGKTIGQHVEETAISAQEAKLAAQLAALQLEQYKAEQATIAQREHDQIQQYMDADAAAHVELRALITQVALNKPVV